MAKGSFNVVPRQSGPITDDQRRRIYEMLISGEFPIDAAIAREVNVPTHVVTEILEKDPELSAIRKSSQREIAQLIEKSAIDLCTSSRNDMARAKLIPEMLKHLMPERYGDNAEQNNSPKGSKKIVLNLSMKELKVDADGIPIPVANSQSPLDA